MGNVEKSALMEAIHMSLKFTKEEINILDRMIGADKDKDNEAVLTSPAIEILEAKGLLKRLYEICDENKFFVPWLEAVKKGNDYIN